MSTDFIDRGQGGDQALATSRWATQADINMPGATWHDLMAYANTVPGLMLGEFPVDAPCSACDISNSAGASQEYQYRLGDQAALFWKDDRHVVTIAGNRADKGVALIVPNVALYAGSILVNDPKGEVATLTAERRGNGSSFIQGLGQKVAVLDPYRVADVPDSYRSCFNPLDALGPHNPHTVADAGLLASAFSNPQADSNGTSQHFDDLARNWIEALILHCISTEPPERRNLLTVYRYLTLGVKVDRPEGATGTAPLPFTVLRQLMRNNKAYDGLVEAAERMYSQMGPNEASGLMTTSERMLSFLKSEGPREMFSRSMSFPLDTLKSDTAGCTIYMCLPVTNLKTHAGIMRMLIQQAIKMMERTPGKPATGHPVLFVLDEFSSLRKIEILEDAAPYMAGFGAKLWAILQDLGQLKAVYADRWETFLSNAGVVMAWANPDETTRTYLSRAIGEAEVRRTTRGTNAGAGLNEGANAGSSAAARQGGKGESQGSSAAISESEGESTSEQIQRGALLTPDEISRLFNRESGRMLVLINGALPLVLKRVRYYERFEFMGKVGQVADFPRPLVSWLDARIFRNETYQEWMASQSDTQNAAAATHGIAAASAQRKAALYSLSGPAVALLGLSLSSWLWLVQASPLSGAIAGLAALWFGVRLFRHARPFKDLQADHQAMAAQAEQSAQKLDKDLAGFVQEREWLNGQRQ